MFSAAMSPESLSSDHRADPAGGRRPSRDAFFDNAKYLAIVLVAVGHAWEPVKGDSRTLQGLYMVVYAFHMPAFIIISGYFSRSFDLRPDRLKRLITGIAVPYILFETAYFAYRRFWEKDAGADLSLLDPWYLTWFLCALFLWRLTTPIWKLIRWPLPVALGIAMVATLSPEIGDDLDMQRVLQFLPCFVLGLCLRREHFRMVRRTSVRILSVPVFAAAALAGWWAVPRMDSSWFYRSNSAEELGAPWWAGPVMVPVMFGGAVLLTACFFAWVPGRTTWFTALGTGTMAGYLLHGFVVKLADHQGWYDPAWLRHPLGEIFVTAVAAAGVTLLCTPFVMRGLRFALEPRMDWAFRPDAGRAARERRSSGERAGTEAVTETGAEAGAGSGTESGRREKVDA
ncbi:acyltransferase family protein [Streptomyces sp. NPDC091377]|uniref:acyltransferase family protein n=1 Tax=Streptomyces sp. NPDC091377 TaxID=3365995 RepID=UPI0037F19D7B